MRNRVPGGVGLVMLLTFWAAVSALLRTADAQQPPAPGQPLSTDVQAMLVLDSARRGYNERRFDFAAERFREFLRLYSQHKEATSAHYGLGLSLLELPQPPQKDFNAIISALQTVVAKTDFPDRPFALYYLGIAQRGVARQFLDQAKPDANPNDLANLRNSAAPSLTEAAKNLALAADAFAARLKTLPPTADLSESPDLQWMARSRTGQCEALLRLDKFKEVAELAQPLVADKNLQKSRYRDVALYHLGYAQFALRDYPAAARSLSQLAPFAQEFGVHARYLLTRTQHMAGQRPEAIAGYKALLADFDQQKKMATEALRNAGALKPEERQSLEAMLKTPPEHILRATFYNLLLQAEEGRFGEAADGLTTLLPLCGNTPLADEVRLRQGYCQVQVRNNAEAMKTLQPLQNHQQLADRAMWWYARAQAGSADPTNAGAYEQTLRSAIEMLNRAAERAASLASNDPEAKVRRGDILMELGDTQQMVKLYRDAANTYQKVLTENISPDRAEEAMQRQVTALHMAAAYKESDELAVKFEQAYPKSTLLPAVWFRAAENTCLSAMTAANDPNMRTRRAEVDKMFDEAIARYQRVLTKYPGFAYVNLARYGLATAHYQRGQYPEAIAALSPILEAERMGDLAGVNYLMADCYLRLLPPETADAIQAGRLIDRAEQAAKLLEKYAGSQGTTPQAADAMLKMGHCYQRIGAVLVDPLERQKMLTKARETYERIVQQFSATPSMPAAVLERARCLALLGDMPQATSEMNRFTSDPFRSSPVGPLGLIRLGSLMRSQNRAADAVNVLAQCRSQFEQALANDPERSGWVPLLQYEHALAVKDTGKFAEARTMFEGIVKQFAGRPEAANAAWRAGQCRREELLAALAAARMVPAKPNVTPQEIAAATKSIEDGFTALRQTAEFFKTEAAKLAPGSKAEPTAPATPAAGEKTEKSEKPAKPAAASAVNEAYLRMLYEAAWCYRALAESEIEAARQKLQSEALTKLLAKKAAANQPVPVLNPPEVPLANIPVQPAEKSAQEQYAAIIAVASTSPLAIRARLELAELTAQRGQNEAALETLVAALEDNPPLELTERIRLRLATCLLTKGDVKAALAQTQLVTKNTTSIVLAEARYLEGEIHIQNKDWPNAVTQLMPFRDQQPLQNLPGLSDRALLRLGYALAEAKRWDESRQVLETLTQRFPQSPWLNEARYGMGWAWQNMGQHDNAYNAYTQVIQGTAAEVAARAQLQMGLCRMTQRRHPDALKDLLAVAFAYDYAEHSAVALCEAGQAQVELKQPAEAAKLWQAVIRDYASSKSAETAKQRLGTLK